jgi:hypothetical protein
MNEIVIFMNGIQGDLGNMSEVLKADLINGINEFIKNELIDQGYPLYVIENIRKKGASQNLRSKLSIDVYDASSFSPHLCFAYKTKDKDIFKIGVITIIRDEITIMDISKCRAQAQIAKSHVNILLTTERIPVILKRYFDFDKNSPLLFYLNNKMTNIGHYNNKIKMVDDWFPRSPIF